MAYIGNDMIGSLAKGEEVQLQDIIGTLEAHWRAPHRDPTSLEELLTEKKRRLIPALKTAQEHLISCVQTTREGYRTFGWRQPKRLHYLDSPCTSRGGVTVHGQNIYLERLKLNYISISCLSLLKEKINPERKQRAAKLKMRQAAVLDWHKATEEKFLAARVQILKAGNMAGFKEMMQTSQNGKLKEILERTDKILEEIMLRISQADRGLSKELANAPDIDKRWALLARGLEADITKQPAMLAAGSLHPFQMKGLQWLVALHDRRLSGILADEMGLGKTVQVARAQQKQSVQLVLTSHDLLMRDAGRLTSICWHYLVIDEGHRIKNAGCKLHGILRSYNADHRLLLTATPVQNNLGELWNQMAFLLPHVFKGSDDLLETFSIRNKEEESQEEELLVTNRLHQILRPFLLRRLKQDVASEIPDKIEHIVKCPLSPYQLVLTKLVARASLEGGLKGVAIHNPVMELRNICNHPFTSKLHAEGSELELPRHALPPALRLCGKIDMLDAILYRLIGRHKVLIFCTSTKTLDIIEEVLDWRGWESVRMDGSTPSEERGCIVDKFNHPDSSIFVFLLSMRTGGVGLNLQAADTAIMYDSDWNPQIDLQAQARIHRLGQTKQVLVLRLRCPHSVEEKVWQASEDKRAIADKSILGGLFDRKTNEAERRHFLKTILQSSSKSANAVMSDNVALNRLVARSEEELAELNVLNCDSSPPRVCDNGHQQVCITNSQALWDRQKNACASAGTKTKKTFEQQRIDSIVLNGSCNTHSYTAPLKTSEQGKRCEEKLELGNQAMNMKESPHMSRQADWEEIQPLVAAAEAKASPFTESASFGRGKRRRILGRCKEPDDLEF